MSGRKQTLLAPAPSQDVIDAFLRDRELVPMIRNLVNDWQRANKASDRDVVAWVGEALATIISEERRPAVRAAICRKLVQEFPAVVETLANRRFETMPAAGGA